MRDFYVKLVSNASTSEFPTNKANSLKNRLPQPLVFDDGNWKVGVANITYPIPHIRPDQPPLHSPPNFESDDLICRIRWTTKSKDSNGNDEFIPWTFRLTGADLIHDRMLITGGKALMRYIVNRFQVELRVLVSDKEDSLLAFDGKKYYPEFRWEGEDLILDNSDTFLNEVGDNRKRPEVVFGAKLVEAMKWLTRSGDSFFMMEGNLMTEADSISKDVNKDWKHVDQYRSWTELWNYANEGLQLSSYCNWHFIHLEESYRMAFEGVNETVIVSAPPRGPIYLYLNVGRSTIMGNRVTDLMRAIPHDPTKMTYEPLHIYYKRVRSNLVDIIETQVAENDGKLVDFVSGVTSVTLHYKDE